MLLIIRAVDDSLEESNGEINLQNNNHNINSLPAITTAYQDASLKGIDLSSWPEEVVPYVWEVCKLWNLRPPHKAKDTDKHNSPSAYWIAGALALMDACGEFGLDCLRQVRQDYEESMSKSGGTAPFLVSSPNSLVNMCRAKAGVMRSLDKIKKFPVFVQPRLEEYWLELDGVRTKARFDPDNIPAMYKDLIVGKVDEEV